MTGAVAEPFTYRPGIHLDFTRDLHYARSAAGLTVTRGFSNLFTFTGDNKSYYMGPSGLLVASATNTPRIEYTAAGQPLGLKFEWTRTNLCLHSNDGTNAAWTKTNCTAAKTATGPDGVANSATTLTATAGNATCLQSITSASATRANSVWLKRRTGTGNIDMTVDGGTGWTTKTITTSWARYEITQAAVTNPNIGLRIVTSGDAVDFWCEQLESAVTVASSSIPTTTATVQRAGDVATRSLGGEFSATAGTVVVRGTSSGAQESSAGQSIFFFNDGTTSNRAFLTRVASTNTARFNVSSAGAGQGPVDGTFSNATAFRAAMAWSANDLAMSFNGAAVGTDTSATIPSMNSLNLGHELGVAQMNGHILTFDYWPERKPNGFLVAAST